MPQGSIHKRELDGGKVRWDAYYALTDPVTGKTRQHKRTFRTQREAKTFLAEQHTAIAKGLAVETSAQTMRELLQFWLDNHARHQVSAKTYDGYAATVRLHVIPEIGATRVQKLTPAQLQAYYTRKIDAGCGPRTVELCHTHISQALDTAVKLGWVATNVADRVTPPRWKPREMDTWSAEEARRFLQIAPASVYGPIWQLALATGMRKGELLGLRWQDVDVERAVVSVRQTVGALRGTIEVKRPKTASSRREINVPRDVLDLLLEHRARQLERHHELQSKGLGSLWEDRDLVFPSATGGPIHPDNLDRDFARLVTQANVKRIRIHDLRHSYATLAIALGNPVKVVSESMGHADVSTTLRTYAHVVPAQRTDLANSIGAALFAPSNEPP